MPTPLELPAPHFPPQGVIDKYHINKQWWMLIGRAAAMQGARGGRPASAGGGDAGADAIPRCCGCHTCAITNHPLRLLALLPHATGALGCFAYLYMRPFIRTQLGSAQRYVQRWLTCNTQPPARQSRRPCHWP